MAGLIDRAAASADAPVVRLGLVTDADKLQTLAAAKVLIATSRVEGWGFTPLEALACGTPVVCWKLPAYQESLPDGPAIVRIPLGDSQAFARAVAEMVSLPDDDRSAIVERTRRTPIGWDEVADAEYGVISVAAGVRSSREQQATR